MPEESQQVSQSQPQAISKGINWKTTLVGIVVGGVVVGIGTLGVYLYQDQTKEATSTQVATPKTVTDSAKEQLEQQLSEEEIERIKNEESDQKAESNIRQLATAVEVCRTVLLSQGTLSKDIYNTTDGCGNYSLLVSNGYVSEIPEDPRPTIKTDSLNSVICIWAKGGSIGRNHWAFFATDNAKINLEKDGSKQVTAGNVSVFDLTSNPKECQKL